MHRGRRVCSRAAPAAHNAPLDLIRRAGTAAPPAKRHTPIRPAGSTVLTCRWRRASTSWISFSGNLTPTSFAKLEGPAPRDTPDFSCDGSPIQFGYVTRNHLPSGPSVTTHSAIDNWRITIERVEPCEVTVTCPRGSIATTVNGVTYCCPRDIDPQTPRFCCPRACPPGSQPTTINGVTFCCRIAPNGELCCTLNGDAVQ